MRGEFLANRLCQGPLWRIDLQAILIVAGQGQPDAETRAHLQ
jgi:hypothetical protein